MRLLVIIAVAALAFDLPGQTILWDGGAGTPLYGDAANWNPDGIPGADDDIEIPFGDTVEVNGNYSVRSVLLRSNTLFTIANGSELVVSGSSTVAFSGLGLNSRAVNLGTLLISGCGTDGLLVYGTFRNKNGGVVEIRDAGNYGITIGTADTLYNEGEISIRNSSNHGVYNTGIISNDPSGTIRIDLAGSYGFRNGSNDFFHNYGMLVVDSAASYGVENSGFMTNYASGTIMISNGNDIGLNNRNTFFNQEGGTVHIHSPGDGFGDYGLNNDTGDSLFNAGLIHIARASDDGVFNAGYFLNGPAGTCTIDTSGIDHPGNGVTLASGSAFINEGLVEIDQTSDRGLLNEATMENAAAATLRILHAGKSGFVNSVGDLFENAGEVIIEGCQERGVYNFGMFLNQPTGTVSIRDCIFSGLNNDFQDIVDNFGLLSLSNNGIPEIQNKGVITIRAGGNLEVSPNDP